MPLVRHPKALAALVAPLVDDVGARLRQAAQDRSGGEFRASYRKGVVHAGTGGMRQEYAGRAWAMDALMEISRGRHDRGR